MSLNPFVRSAWPPYRDTKACYNRHRVSRSNPPQHSGSREIEPRDLGSHDIQTLHLPTGNLQPEPPLASSHDREAAAQRILSEYSAGELELAEAFEQLYRLFYPAVKALLARWTPVPEDRDELTQETFLRIYKGIEAFRRDSSFSTYLFKVARNIYLGHRRRMLAAKRNGIEIPLEDPNVGDETQPWEIAPGVAPTQEDEVLAAEQLKQVWGVIERMPEQRRRCLILSYFQGLTVPEMAAVLRLAEGTVKAHLFQARQQLKELLVQAGIALPDGIP